MTVQLLNGWSEGDPGDPCPALITPALFRQMRTSPTWRLSWCSWASLVR